MRHLFAVLISLFIFGVAEGSFIELEPLGESYMIREIDFEEFLIKRAATVDWQKIIEQNFDKSFKNATTANEKLPSAPITTVRKETPSYTLQNEIFTIDKSGKKTVMYPTGFLFNPLDYMTLHEVYYIINGESAEEIEWLKKQDMQYCMIIISEGEALPLSEELEQPVYLLNEYVKNGFFVKYTPSIIKQEKNQLAIYEYKLGESSKTEFVKTDNLGVQK